MLTLQFPSVGLQVLISLLYFLGISVISHCLSRRVATESLTTIEGLSSLSWARICIILTLVDSWLFMFASGTLIFGVGLGLSPGACQTGSLTCVIFYATTKIWMYSFLVERVHVVWTPATGIKRFKSPVYVVSFITISLYAVIIALMFVGRTSFLREGDRICILGLDYLSSLPLLIYDLYINIFLTALFLHPLLKTTVINPRIRRIARRALIATAIALTTSTSNIAIMAVLRGRELGWICLASCGTDVVVNAISIFWITSSSKPRRPATTISLAAGQNNTTSQPIRSILKPTSLTPLPQAVSPNSSQYMSSGPHRITMPYYHQRNGSPSYVPEAKETCEPTRPPLPPLYCDTSPRSSNEPDSDANARASPVPSARLESPSALQSLISLILNETRGSEEESMPEIQIRVTTDVEVQSVHESISDAESIESELSRAHSV